MQVALYARVSTERQERDQTITSQLTALQDWVQHHQHEVRPEHIYTDEGISGSRLDRPALDRLRDAAREGAFALVVVCSPDRLARKYAYQVLVLEELQRAGCRVVFLQRPLSDDPQDQLLLQMQGVIAEYERAVLQERFRRGKLHRARAGQYLGGRAPYGYRYLHKRDQCPGTLVLDEDEAAIVRMLYQWVQEEWLTIRQVQKRLAAGPWRTRAGRSMWSTATGHHILTDPVYSGTAYVNRYCYHAPKKPRVLYPRRGQENTSRTLRPQEEWISVSVPALVDLTTYEDVQQQLARNAQLSWRRNRRHDYVLRCLLRCATCGLALSGRTRTSRGQSLYREYVCAGKDPIRTARLERCPQPPVRADLIEAAVWQPIAALLADPAHLLAQFQQCAQLQTRHTQEEQGAGQQWERRRERLQREEQRLLDAYQAEVITLAELAARRHQLAQRRQDLHAQQEQVLRLRQSQAYAQEVITDLTLFCERIRARLITATFAEQQTILQLLIDRIIVGSNTLEIRHVIPLRSTDATSQESSARTGQLRSDRAQDAKLPAKSPSAGLAGGQSVAHGYARCAESGASRAKAGRNWGAVSTGVSRTVSVFTR